MGHPVFATVHWQNDSIGWEDCSCDHFWLPCHTGSHMPSLEDMVPFWREDAVMQGSYHGRRQSPQNYAVQHFNVAVVFFIMADRPHRTMQCNILMELWCFLIRVVTGLYVLSTCKVSSWDDWYYRGIFVNFIIDGTFTRFSQSQHPKIYDSCVGEAPRVIW